MVTRTYTYDYDLICHRTGATICAEGVSYAANALNQYTHFTYPPNSLPPNSLSPSYDHQSRHIRKEVFARANATCNYEPVTRTSLCGTRNRVIAP